MDAGQNPFGEEPQVVDVRGLGLPRPDELDGQDAGENPGAFANAPWYQVRFLRNRGVLVQYADGAGHLPDGFSMRAVWSRDYTRRLVVNPTALKPRYQPRTQRGRELLVTLIQKRIGRTRCVIPTPMA